MDKEVKKIWLAALRSREYSQGKGRLRRTYLAGGDGYCCLGVLCDLSIRHHNAASLWAEARYDGAGRAFKFNDEGDGYAGMPPREVTYWAGLALKDTEELSTINDKPRTPENDNFAHVIEFIESTL